MLTAAADEDLSVDFRVVSLAMAAIAWMYGCRRGPPTFAELGDSGRS